MHKIKLEHQNDSKCLLVKVLLFQERTLFMLWGNLEGCGPVRYPVPPIFKLPGQTKISGALVAKDLRQNFVAVLAMSPTEPTVEQNE